MTLFQRYQGQLLQRRIGEKIPTDHPESVSATFRLNFQQVQRRSKAAADLLQLCAFLIPDAIPEEILTAGSSFLGPVLSLAVADALLLNQVLKVAGLIGRCGRDPS